MSTITTLRERCRQDRNALYAAIGVSFWALLPLVLFACHGFAWVWQR